MCCPLRRRPDPVVVNAIPVPKRGSSRTCCIRATAVAAGAGIGASVGVAAIAPVSKVLIVGILKNASPNALPVVVVPVSLSIIAAVGLTTVVGGATLGGAAAYCASKRVIS